MYSALQQNGKRLYDLAREVKNEIVLPKSHVHTLTDDTKC
jgi:tRNA U55 pseudouridine synthase TruB